MDELLVAQINDELKTLKTEGRYRLANELQSPQGPEVRMDGGGRIMLSSNNYLGLADDPRVIDGAKKALDEFGNGTASVRFICGTMSLHQKLEKKIAEFLNVEAAVTFISCWDANVGLIPTLAGQDDAVFSDALNHASIIDAIRLTKAKRCVYPHRDTVKLEQLLKENNGARRKLIITDGVFSMEGDLAPLPELARLADKYQAVLAVDESHATGVLGEHGRGTTEHFGLQGQVDIQTSTLGKALGGSCGGYVAAKKTIVDYLIQYSRPHLFSNALPPAVCGGAIAAIEILQTEPQRLKRLHENVSYFREQLSKLGLKVLPGETPIVPVMIGETATAITFQKGLLNKGVFVCGFGYPVVPKGEARLRCQICATHTKEHLDRAGAAFKEVKKDLGL
ncbi:MAG: glycine C-acetyltransferase [Actinobacteria bacterium]|nr:glycine C-acetyltransferase [Actinomycetota bacterium]